MSPLLTSVFSVLQRKIFWCVFVADDLSAGFLVFEWEQCYCWLNSVFGVTCFWSTWCYAIISSQICKHVCISQPTQVNHLHDLRSLQHHQDLRLRKLAQAHRVLQMLNKRKQMFCSRNTAAVFSRFWLVHCQLCSSLVSSAVLLLLVIWK